MSKFRITNAAYNDIYYIDRGLDRHLMMEISTCQFIDTNSNIVFHGFTGSGKSYLACAIGKQACMQGINTHYIRIPDLLMLRDEAILTNQGIPKMLKKFSKYKLLILDEWLLDDLSDDEQHFLYELIERRYDSTSTIFCTQYKKENWHSRLGGGVHADAIMDRIVHNVLWIYAGNINMRERYSKQKSIIS
jgi:DNA replication protein DnaC